MINRAQRELKEELAPTQPGLYESERYPRNEGYNAYLFTDNSTWYEVQSDGVMFPMEFGDICPVNLVWPFIG